MRGETAYFTAILTMAMHTDGDARRAKALGLLERAIGSGLPPLDRGTVVHDGTTILQASDGMAQLLGVRAAQLVGRPIACIVHASRRAALAAGLRYAWTSGPVSGRATLVRHGQPVSVDASAHVVTLDGVTALQVDFVAVSVAN